MLGGADADLDRAKAMGISLFAGEAEGRLDEVLRDAAAGALKPLYNFMDDLPSIEGAPIPLLTAERVQRTAGGGTSFDAGRGCPVPVLVLHHHQRAGAQVAPPLARRHREDRARQLRAGAAHASSSPTTISPATRTGSRSSTA